MKPVTIVLLVITVVLLVGNELFRRIAEKKITDKLTKLFLEGDFDALDKELDKKLTRYLVPPFNLDYLRLNEALAKGKKKEIDAQFEHFEHVRLNNNQKQLIDSNAFYYYVGNKDEKNARKYYERINASGLADEDKKVYSRLYDTYILKGYRYLEETEKELLEAKEKEKAPLEALLAVMYENKGDKEKAQAYYRKVEEFSRRMEESVKAEEEK